MKKYDVIVIGSGIGGLVCANYLVQRGKKVLIVEKNKEVGGYCTSFKRRGILFDTTIHAIQNCGKGSVLNKIFSELDVLKRISFIRRNPTDTIIYRDLRVDIDNSLEKTKKNLQKAFPKEKKGIDGFLDLIAKKDLVYFYSRYKNETCKSLLDCYFDDPILKKMFGVFLANIGSLKEKTSALAAFALFKQFLLFGGYYPKGGMQIIPDVLLEKFKEKGGDVLLNHKVEEIVINGQNTEGVLTRNGDFIKANTVVSNSDLTHTYSALLKAKKFDSERKKISTYSPSLSIYIVYLTLKKRLSKIVDYGPGVWYILDPQAIKNRFNTISKEIMPNEVIFCSVASKLDESVLPENCDVLRLMVNAIKKNEAYWKRYAVEFSESIINSVESIFPGLHREITCKGRATPITMQNYTLNRDGAICGWMNTVEQINQPITTFLSGIKGLYCAGHWMTTRYGNGGVAMAADSGRAIAKHILKKVENT